jgi:sulfur-oxidizing protein SoxA
MMRVKELAHRRWEGKRVAAWSPLHLFHLFTFSPLHLLRLGLAVALAALVELGVAAEQDDQDARTRAEIAKYREMLQEANPAEFSEARGEELWSMPAGPKAATLEQCDLGLGPGRIKGAYAQLPRWFEDTRQVQDAESRLVTCMIALQGLTREQATKDWYRAGSNMEALVTYLAGQSREAKIAVPEAHAEERATRELGETLFFRRSGPLDFSCATCHSQPGKRIRLTEVADFLVPADARTVMAQWPSYRVSHGQVWTMERRIVDCMRQMRWPQPQYLSEAIIALQAFLQKQAEGASMEAPGIKR